MNECSFIWNICVFMRLNDWIKYFYDYLFWIHLKRSCIYSGGELFLFFLLWQKGGENIWLIECYVVSDDVNDLNDEWRYQFELNQSIFIIQKYMLLIIKKSNVNEVLSSSKRGRIVMKIWMKMFMLILMMKNIDLKQKKISHSVY